MATKRRHHNWYYTETKDHKRLLWTSILPKFDNLEEMDKPLETYNLTRPSLRNLWDTIKPIDIGIMGVPEEERRGAEWIFEEVMMKNKDTSYSNCQKPKTKRILKTAKRSNLSHEGEESSIRE